MRWIWPMLWCAGCTPESPSEALTHVERWELLGVMGDGSVVDARMTVGNAGLLRGQGHVEVDHWPRQGEPVRYARWSAPSATTRSADGRSVVFDTDRLRGTGVAAESWHLRARSDDANAVLVVQGTSGVIPPVSATIPAGTWTVDAPVGAGAMKGWIEAGDRGGKVDGWGIVTHRSGAGRPGSERRGVYVMSDDLVLGIDEQGSVRLLWGRLAGRGMDMSTAKITYDDGVVGIDLRPAEALVVRLDPTTAHGQTDRTGDWTPPERWGIAVLGGRTARHVVGAQVSVLAGELPEQPRRGLVVWTDSRPLDLPVVTTDKPQRRKRRSTALD